MLPFTEKEKTEWRAVLGTEGAGHSLGLGHVHVSVDIREKVCAEDTGRGLMGIEKISKAM